MSRIAYVNGTYTPLANAQVSMEDRGYHFADGAYEVIFYNDNQCFVDLQPHLDRLRDSLKALHIPLTYTDRSLRTIVHELMRRNRCRQGYLYVQITRGKASRDHTVPTCLQPVMTMFVRPHQFPKTPRCIVAHTERDMRWRHNNVKSIALLGSVLAKYHAYAKGGDEAVLVDDAGQVTEGSSTNIWMVTPASTLVTHPANQKILNGIVRQRLLEMAKKEGVSVEERPFSLEEALQASELFITSTTKATHAITELDGHTIGEGGVGPLTARLHKAYLSFLRSITEDVCV